MLKSIFLLFICLFVWTQTVYSQWDFAVTTQTKILLFDEQWTEVNAAAHQFEGLLSITFDESDERIYFSDYKHNTSSIFSLKIPLGKGSPHIIDDVVARTPKEQVTGLAYDPLDRNIYWTDYRHRKIHFYSIDADKDSKPEVLFDFAGKQVRPDGIAIDICRRKLYWSNSESENGSINKASLNGQDHEVLITSKLHSPRGIAVDQLTDRIYYVVDQDGIHFTVESANLDGSDRQILVEDINNAPISLTVTRDSVYWTDMHYTAVWKIPKFNFTDIEPIKVKVFDSRIGGIVSRFGMLTKLKSDPDCKDVIQKIEEQMRTRGAQTSNKKKIEENNQMVCLGNGFYNEAANACACDPGYSGYRCQTYSCTNFCFNGRCTIKDGYPTCTCEMGFEGEHCQTSKCSNHCFNGTCAIKDGYPTCTCKTGFEGERCQTSKCSSYCFNGTCTIKNGYPTCTCKMGFEGERCQTSKCSSYCLNDGHCTIKDDEPVCHCSDEFVGDQCERNLTETCLPFCMPNQNKIDFFTTKPEYCSRFDCPKLESIDTNRQRQEGPAETVCRSSWNKSVIVIVCGVLVALLLIYLTILTLRRVYKPLRPRIKKTIVLQKKISSTPLTCRPIATEQCEITIEDCCNNTVCETPCFDPKLLQKSMDDARNQHKEDREMLIDNMENEMH